MQVDALGLSNSQTECYGGWIRVYWRRHLAPLEAAGAENAKLVVVVALQRARLWAAISGLEEGIITKKRQTA